MNVIKRMWLLIEIKLLFQCKERHIKPVLVFIPSVSLRIGMHRLYVYAHAGELFYIMIVCFQRFLYDSRIFSVVCWEFPYSLNINILLPLNFTVILTLSYLVINIYNKRFIVNISTKQMQCWKCNIYSFRYR